MPDTCLARVFPFSSTTTPQAAPPGNKFSPSWCAARGQVRGALCGCVVVRFSFLVVMARSVLLRGRVCL